jgi:methionine sulfoxide reductase heme-binding subunit
LNFGSALIFNTPQIMQDVKFYKLLITLNGLIPLILATYDFVSGRAGTNPIEFAVRTTGVLTLIFLLITLAITPLRKIFGWNGLIKYRRRIGLFAFFYGSLHFLIYFVYEKTSYIVDVLRDVIQRPFILVGMLAFLLMIPLAVTSTNAMVKRLGGKRWASLHKLTYFIAVLGVLHFYMLVKSDVFYPVLFGLILAILLFYRLYDSNKKSNPQEAKTN